MRLCITTQVTAFYEVPEDNEDGIVCELCDNIENGIGRMFDEGLFTGDEDAECLTFEVSAFRTEFAPLLPAADHIESIWRDLRALRHDSHIPRDSEEILRLGRERGLVDENGMYDMSEAVRLHARDVLENGL